MNIKIENNEKSRTPKTVTKDYEGFFLDKDGDLHVNTSNGTYMVNPTEGDDPGYLSKWESFEELIKNYQPLTPVNVRIIVEKL